MSRNEIAEIIQTANNISVDIQIKMENYDVWIKDIYNKICRSYPHAETLENINSTYKNLDKTFKLIGKSIEKYNEYKNTIDFIAEIEPTERNCLTAHIFHHVKLYMDEWILNNEERLCDIFVIKCEEECC